MIFVAATMILTVGILGYIVYRQKEVLFSYEWHIQWWAVLVAFVVYILALLIVVQVWVWVLEQFSIRVTYKKHFYYIAISNLARRLPGTVWYIAWRAKMYQENGLSARLISLCSGIELSILIVSGIIVSILFAFQVLLRYQLGIWAILALLILSLAFLNPWVLSRLSKRFGKWMEESNISFKKTALMCFAFCFVWILGGIQLFYVINTIYPLAYQHLGYVIGCWSLVGVLSYFLFLIPSNFGLYELSMSLLLSTVMPSSLAVIVMIFNRVEVILFEIIVALVTQALNEIDIRKQSVEKKLL